MRNRIAELLLAELLAFGAFVCGGLALLGGAVTWTGGSRHPAVVSWLLVALFAATATGLGRVALTRLRRAFQRTAPDPLNAPNHPGENDAPVESPSATELEVESHKALQTH